VTDSRSAPNAPLGAEPAADSTIENSTIITTAISTQRLRNAMANSALAAARMRFIARPSG